MFSRSQGGYVLFICVLRPIICVFDIMTYQFLTKCRKLGRGGRRAQQCQNSLSTQLMRFAVVYIADPDGREGQYQQGKHLRSSQLAGVLSSGVRG